MKQFFTCLFVSGIFFCLGGQMFAQCVPDPPLELGQDITMCTGDSTSLSISPNYVTILWSTGDTTATIPVTAGGTYSVAITDSNGCAATDAIDVVENSIPVIDLVDSLANGAVVGDQIDLCVGDSAHLFANAGIAAYLWQDSLSGDPTTDADFLVTSTVAGTMTYGVEGRNLSQFSSCATTDSVIITFHDVPVVDLAPNDTAFCGPGSITLAAPTGLVSYAWSTGDTTESIAVTATGTYYVSVIGPGGCEAQSDTSVVTVYDSPAMPIILDMGDQFQADPLLAGAAYQWYRNDTALTDGASGTLSHGSTPGDYYVEVTSADGCPGAAPSDTVNIPVPPIPNTFSQENIPELITPNGDSFNDFLSILNIATWAENELTIVNRYGQEVFKATGYDNLNNTFDGHAENGEMLPDGTYYYILDLKDSDFDLYKGFIVISR